jgi:YHS domain-containing protein/positive regulator of sigma E activity
MMKESKGYVVSVSGDGRAQVMVEMDNSAKGCSSQSEHCHCAGKGGSLPVKVENRAGAKVGDYVSVLFKPGALLKSVLILLGIPSLGILAGAITGTALNERSLVSPNQAFLAGAACFAFAVIAAVLIYRGIASELQPFVDRIITSGAGAKVFAGVDPVCGRAVDPLNAAAKIDYDGRTYHFCQAGCLDAFIKDPQRYLGSLPCADCH